MSERLICVIKLGLRRFAPFSLPPRAIIDQAKVAFSCAEASFFRTVPPLTKASFRRCGTARKKRSTCVERFCLVVIRLETENMKVGKRGERFVKNISIWQSVCCRV